MIKSGLSELSMLIVIGPNDITVGWSRIPKAASAAIPAKRGARPGSSLAASGERCEWNKGKIIDRDTQPDQNRKR